MTKVNIKYKTLLYISAINGFLITFGLVLGIIFIIHNNPNAVVVEIPGIDIRTNWMSVLFQLNAGFEDIQFEHLRILNAMDFILLISSSILIIGISVTIRKDAKVLSILSIIQPILGFVILLITHIAGRCAMFSGIILICFAMLKSKKWEWYIPVWGIIAALFLFLGDVITENEKNIFVSIVIMIGYIAFMIWTSIIGIKLIEKIGMKNFVNKKS